MQILDNHDKVWYKYERYGFGYILSVLFCYAEKKEEAI